MNDGKIVRDPLSKIFDKIGISGAASSVMTIIIGLYIVYSELEWEQVRVILGLFLFIIGIINLSGYILSLLAKAKSEKTYIETEVFHPNIKETENGSNGLEQKDD